MTNNFISSSLYKTPLFSKGLITFIIYFISLIVSVSHEPITDEIFLLSILWVILIPAFKRKFGMYFSDLGISLFLIKPIVIVAGIILPDNILGSNQLIKEETLPS